ncbi:MAG: response regulator transcription factor [Actinomycetes bacterium]
MRILVVEDDPSISEPLISGLARNGFAAEHVATGGAALVAVDKADLVLLDLGLPDIDGIEVCRQIRQRSAVPIIVVSARSDEVERVLLLELGADDYVVKPFGLREVVARIRAVARRTGTDNGASQHDALTISAGPLSIDVRAHEVSVDGTLVELTPKEFDLLAYLAADPGAVHTRRRILEDVWDPNWFGSPKTLDVHIASLRKKLGHPEWIHAVRGVGFKLTVDGDPQ